MPPPVHLTVMLITLALTIHLDRPFAYFNATLAARATQGHPSGAINAVLVSVGTGVAVHGRGSWKVSVGCDFWKILGLALRM